jgi:SAM-dependent methyltransferase
VAPTQSSDGRRKQLGAWATPDALVDLVVSRTVTADWLARRTGPIRVLDPACGDGRFLRAAARRITEFGRTALLTGVDVDPLALEVMACDATLAGAERICHDALAAEWGGRTFDLVVGNPPFLSQMASGTSRGGSSRHGGGPYADAAAEFLALAVGVAAPDGGRVGLVLPQSVLASRDAGGVRVGVERVADMIWSWWSPEQHFDAEVLVCALGFERSAAPAAAASPADGVVGASWSHVVVRHLGIPDLPRLEQHGTVGDRSDLNANFRDEYYGLVPAVADHADGPPLVTAGLIDPGRCHWGDRPVRFAKQTFAAPRVDRSLLDERMQRWARRKLVPKVLVATQTSVVEAVVDADGQWLPGVPVTSVVPHPGESAWEIGAVLTSPVATVAAWHLVAGTGLSARTVRLGPSGIAGVPWPAGSLDAAVEALRSGDVVACGLEVTRSFGVSTDHPMVAWWSDRISRVTGGRSPGASRT